MTETGKQDIDTGWYGKEVNREIGNADEVIEHGAF